MFDIEADGGPMTAGEHAAAMLRAAPPDVSTLRPDGAPDLMATMPPEPPVPAYRAEKAAAN